MIYILTVLIYFIVYINYKLSNKDLAHPCVVGTGAFFFCSLVACGFANILYKDISPLTVLYVTCGLIVFSIAGLIVTHFFPIVVSKFSGPRQLKKIDIKYIIMYSLLGVAIVAVFFFFLQEMLNNYTGGKIDIETFMEKSREANLNQNNVSIEEKVFPLWIKVFFLVADCISYVCLYRHAYNKIFYPKYTKNFLYLFPVMISIIHTILIASRITILNFAVFYLSMYSIFCFIKFDPKYARRRITKLFTKILFFIGWMFIFLGMLRAGGDYDNIASIFRYTGASIIDLDDALSTWPKMINEDLSQKKSLTGFFYSLQFIFDVDSIRTAPPAITFWDGGRSNIYSALGHYYMDFGYMGIIFCGLAGIVATILYNVAMRNIESENMLLAYGYFSIGIYMFPISDLIFSRISILMIASIIIICCINRCIDKYLQ